MNKNSKIFIFNNNDLLNKSVIRIKGKSRDIDFIGNTIFVNLYCNGNSLPFNTFYSTKYIYDSNQSINYSIDIPIPNCNEIKITIKTLTFIDINDIEAIPT